MATQEDILNELRKIKTILADLLELEKAKEQRTQDAIDKETADRENYIARRFGGGGR